MQEPEEKNLSSLVRPMGITIGRTCLKKLSHSAQCSPTDMIKINMAGTEQITNYLNDRSSNAVVGDLKVTV